MNAFAAQLSAAQMYVIGAGGHVLPRVVADVPTSRPAIRAAIRRAPGWIAGYAAVWHSRFGSGQFYMPKAFDRAIHAPGVLLFVDHEWAGADYADTDRQTLLLSVDEHGCWFEASSPALVGRVAAGELSGVSLGCQQMVTAGHAITEIVGLHEVSLLSRRVPPRCPTTWVAEGAAAVARRDFLMAAHRRRNPHGTRFTLH